MTSSCIACSVCASESKCRVFVCPNRWLYRFGLYVNITAAYFGTIGGFFVIMLADTPLDMLLNALAFEFLKEVDDRLVGRELLDTTVVAVLKEHWDVDRDATPAGLSLLAGTCHCVCVRVCACVCICSTTRYCVYRQLPCDVVVRAHGSVSHVCPCAWSDDSDWYRLLYNSRTHNPLRRHPAVVGHVRGRASRWSTVWSWCLCALKLLFSFTLRAAFYGSAAAPFYIVTCY